MDPEVREILAAKTPKAARRLLQALDAKRPIVVGNGPHATLEYAIDHDMRVKAAEAIFNRLYGRPTQAVTGEDGGPIKVDMGLLETLQRLAGG